MRSGESSRASGKICRCRPGFHLNKKYWNDIYLQRDMPNDEIRFWISHSYAEVIKLPRIVREKYIDVL